jgi:alpha-galactosidase
MAMKKSAAFLFALALICGASLGAAPVHRLVTAWRFADQTDGHNELVQKSEWLLMDNDNPVDVRANVLDVADLLCGTGVVYVVEGPVTISRWDDKPDFTFSGTALVVHSNGFHVAALPYSGGAFGRLRALRVHSRRHHPYDPRRDGLMMSNTWGDRNGFVRINAQDMLRELDAAASLGVDVMQIDAGWANVNEIPRERATGSLEWERFWNPPEDAWAASGKRFPKGIKEIYMAAKEKGIALGLWFAPDCANDAAAWRRDADILLNLWRREGVRFFKTDFMSVYSKRGFDNERAFFDAVLDESSGDVAFDLDVTGNVPRLGYFGAPRCGLFVENRYARKGERRPYYPHRTLRNLWTLSETVDPIRLRMEFMNPLRNAETYGGSPLAPSKWPADALLATVLASSPLAWMDCVDVKEVTLAAWRPLVAVWKRAREDWYSGTIAPIGERPDGVSWTGFASVSENGRGGFALVFRELSKDGDYAFDLRPYFGELTAVPEVIAGRGTAVMKNGRLSVNIPAELDFVWVRF